MTIENTETTNETEIRQLINDWATATREGNNDEVLTNHASDVLIFDVLAPLQYECAEAYRKAGTSGNQHQAASRFSRFTT